MALPKTLSQPKQMRLSQSDHLLPLIDSVFSSAISIDVSSNKTHSVFTLFYLSNNISK